MSGWVDLKQTFLYLGLLVSDRGFDGGWIWLPGVGTLSSTSPQIFFCISVDVRSDFRHRKWLPISDLMWLTDEKMFCQYIAQMSFNRVFERRLLVSDHILGMDGSRWRWQHFDRKCWPDVAGVIRSVCVKSTPDCEHAEYQAELTSKMVSLISRLVGTESGFWHRYNF